MKVIVDTREQKIMEHIDWEIIRMKLDEGDYTAYDLLEYEKATGNKTVRIERKSSVSELANNLDKTLERFEREMTRLFDYERKVLLFEFSLKDLLDFPHGSKLPYNVIKKIKIRPKTMLNRLEYIQNIYDVEIIYAGSHEEATNIADEILRDAIKKTIKR